MPREPKTLRDLVGVDFRGDSELMTSAGTDHPAEPTRSISGAVLGKIHPNPVATILEYARRIRNDRTEMTILRHARDDEMVELEDEVEAWNSGAGNTDRVIAEAMDVVGCMIDLIHHVRPDATLAELDKITVTFCERWAAKYSGSAGKPVGETARERRSSTQEE